MEISVVIPCHNAGLYIIDAINSVTKQTLLPKEIIVIDDSSSDNSLEIVKSLGVVDKVIALNASNAAVARNRGISLSKSKWVAFLDADDEWTIDHLERAAYLMGRNDIAYISTCKYRYPEDRSKIYDYIWEDPWPKKGSSGLDRWKFMEWFSATTSFAHSTLVASRKELGVIRGYDENLRRRHDYELFLRLICHGTWTFDPVPSMVYQKNSPNSISMNLVDCNYYFLKGLINNYDKYHSVQMNKLLKSQAREAMRIALINGSHEEKKNIWNLSKTIFNRKEEMIFNFLLRNNKLAPYAYTLKDRIFSTKLMKKII